MGTLKGVGSISQREDEVCLTVRECFEWSCHGTGTSSAVFVSDVCEG
jgi:hypothetical protein